MALDYSPSPSPSPEITEGEAEPPKKEGRPPIWTDPIELKELISDYFISEKGRKKPTLSGLALAIGIDRRTLYNYQQKDEFFPTIKKARDRIEENYEENLLYGERTTGFIFALKNMGWSDKLETDVTTKGKELPTPILNGVTNVHPNNSNEQDPEVK
jgi:hypothetical protein